MSVLNARNLAGAVLCALWAVPLQSATAQEPTGIRADLIADLDQTEEKWVALADAMSADLYAWRPMEGVRSVGEVFMHIAGANVFFAKFVGYTPTDDLPEALKNFAPGVERSPSDMAQTKALLHASFETARAAIRSIPDADLEQTMEFFGQDMSKRAMILLLCTHAHEHLGQQVAYARSNKVVPPWSQGGQ